MTGVDSTFSLLLVCGAVADIVGVESNHKDLRGHTPERIQEIGRDLEAIVLARAVRWHAERRVLLDGQRSVILS